MEEELRDRWAADLGRERASATTLDGLLARYREPHRHYHTLPHVLRVLRTIDELLAKVRVADAAAVRLAAWYHDAVYDPTAVAGANEAASAALARRDLRALVERGRRVDDVVRLVLVTASHEPAPGLLDEVVVCDADLAVLAAEPAEYAAYAAGVRAEYAHVPEPEWRTGRAAVLSALQERPKLFHTELMHAREPAARANLAAELASLT
jgi:predicted metal-dependent HD superfamily phosphohydrolase